LVEDTGPSIENLLWNLVPRSQFFSEKSVKDTDRWLRLRQRTISYDNITHDHLGRMSYKKHTWNFDRK